MLSWKYQHWRNILPTAFTATSIVAFNPLSPDIALPTSLIPLAEIILGGTRTVEL
jgi:hypothetical protein